MNKKQKMTNNEYLFIKNQLYLTSMNIVFMKDYMINISNNLINLHKLKIYENVNDGYSVLFDKLMDIKTKLDKYPDFIKMNFLKKTDMDTLTKEINDIRTEIIILSNHIGPSDIRLLLHLLLGPLWYNYFNYNELSYVNLMSRLFNTISVWDSSFHTSENTIINENKETVKKSKFQMTKKRIDKRQTFNIETLVPLIEDNITTSIIIGDVNSFPMFIHNLNDMIKNNKIAKNNRNNIYNYETMNKLFNEPDSNIIFIKNDMKKLLSLIEDKNGFNIGIKVDSNRIIIIQGYATDDMLDLYKTNNLINEKFNHIRNHILNNDNIKIPLEGRKNYIDILNVRDILVYTKEEYEKFIISRYNDYIELRNKNLSHVITEFMIVSAYRKFEILLMFLCGDVNDCKLAYLLYDMLKVKDKKESKSVEYEIYNSLPMKFKVKLDETEKTVSKEEENLTKNHMADLSYERRINMLKVEHSIKDKAIDKLKSMKGNFQGDNKAQSWLDGFLKIPFGIYKENKIINFKNKFIKENPELNAYSCNEIKKSLSLNKKDMSEWNKYMEDKSKYLKDVRMYLDEAVYGHNDAKLQLERLFAQWINGETKGSVIGLCGPPGTGKTSLAKNGLSKCLIDDDMKPRPFAFLPIGGSVNGSTLVGHNFTYVGSTWGRIVDVLMIAGCMNPIIFIDEVDKISNTEYGKEITSILTHLTDLTQNDSFEDKYFSGIPLDLSKALIVLSYNDASLIDPILRDRITTIETKPYTITDKLHIIQEYMLPQVLKEVGFDKNEILFSNEVISYLINTYTNEAGVRKIKEKIVEIVRDINLKSIHDVDTQLPITITKEYCDELFKNKPKIKPNLIHKNPEVGLVNGLYATTTGIGGLTPIQVMKYPSHKMFDLTITGQQGDVMKESVMYALRIAYGMLSEEEKAKLLDDSKNNNNFGLLVHTPDAGTKKDGPSAGAAMTLAIYSVLTNKKIKNNIAMTGEIDLYKNVKAIGGVYAKLTGAKAAGVKLALIPKENLEDLIILRNENNSPEDENFKVEIIETLEDVIKAAVF